MLSKEEHARLDKVLSERFGLTSLGLPLMRLSWTSDQTEILVAEHELWADGVFIKSEVGPKEVLKYPGVPNRYCIEKLEPAPPELPEKPYTYEAIYFFQDKDGNYLEPIEEVCCFVSRCFLTARYPGYSKDFWLQVHEEEERKTLQYFKDVLEDGYPWLVNQLASGCAVGYTGEGNAKEHTDKSVSAPN